MSKNLSLLAVAVLLVPNFSFAEPKTGNVGRYSDGRAYRVDSQGYQLSDQIAELEVTIQEQEKQITACESELSGKGGAPQKIAQCPKTECPKAESLTNVTTSKSPTAEQCAQYTNALTDKVAVLNSKLQQTSNEQGELSTKTALLNAEVAELRSKLSKSPKAETISQLSEESLKLRQELASKEDISIKQSSTLSAAIKLEQERVQKLEAVKQQLDLKISQLQSDLQGKSKREEELLANIDDLSQQLGSKSEPSRDTSRGMLASKASEVPVNVKPVTIDSSKQIANQLSEIQKLVIRRKDIFDSVRSSRKGVTIQMQPLLTENGRSLDQLRHLAQSGDENLSSDLNQIKSILTGDIQVMERLISRL
jgi:hypothetical protein